MAGKDKLDSGEVIIEPTDICPNCGSKMLLEDGKLVCPHCDSEIDYFGEDEDE